MRRIRSIRSYAGNYPAGGSRCTSLRADGPRRVSARGFCAGCPPWLGAEHRVVRLPHPWPSDARTRRLPPRGAPPPREIPAKHCEMMRSITYFWGVLQSSAVFKVGCSCGSRVVVHHCIYVLYTCAWAYGLSARCSLMYIIYEWNFLFCLRNDF